MPDVVAPPDPSPDTPAPHQDWVAGRSSQAAIHAMGRFLQTSYGSPSKDGYNAGLRNGIIGVALDHVQQRVVVIADAAKVNHGTLRARLQSEVANASGGEQPFDLVVQQGCEDSADLNRTLTILNERNWHPRAADVAYAFSLNPRTSTYEFTISETDRDVAEALTEEVGSTVTVDYSGVSSSLDAGSRWPDTDPHWGGAHIWAPGYINSDCTSGFTVRLSNGSLGSVTAGHCYDNDTNIDSGGAGFGITKGKYNAPTYDMIRIHPFGETFARKLHTNPCCPEVRTVIGHGPAGLSELVCHSGMVTKAICGLEVQDLNATLCPPGSTSNCTPGLMTYTKGGQTVAARGDSGGPVYTRPNTTDAWIRGMHIASTPDTTKTKGWAERIAVIKSHLEVDVLEN